VKIIWANEAIQDLKSIQTYIEHDEPVAAIDTILFIAQYAEETLEHFPFAGRRGKVKNTRELVIPRLPYLLPYHIEDNTIFILAVIHTARLWPPHED